jgi:hypothetical protein
LSLRLQMPRATAACWMWCGPQPRLHAQVLGRALKDLPRDQIVVATKVGTAVLRMRSKLDRLKHSASHAQLVSCMMGDTGGTTGNMPACLPVPPLSQPRTGRRRKHSRRWAHCIPERLSDCQPGTGGAVRAGGVRFQQGARKSQRLREPPAPAGVCLPAELSVATPVGPAATRF